MAKLSGFLRGGKKAPKAGSLNLWNVPDNAKNAGRSVTTYSLNAKPKTEKFPGMDAFVAQQNPLPMDTASRMARARELGATWANKNSQTGAWESFGGREDLVDGGVSQHQGANRRRSDQTATNSYVHDLSAGTLSVYDAADKVARHLAERFPQWKIGKRLGGSFESGVAYRSGSAMGQSAYIDTPFGQIRVSDHASGFRPGQMASVGPDVDLARLERLLVDADRAGRNRRAGRIAELAYSKAERMARRLEGGEPAEKIAREFRVPVHVVESARQRVALMDSGEPFAVLPNGAVRSPSAAFDPAKKDSSDLLAGIGPVGGLLALGTGAAATAAGTQDAEAMNIGPMARTWNKAAHEAALAMKRAGKTNKEIFDATGLFQDAGGNWGREISDAGMRLNYGYGRLGDLIRHPPLFEAYPELKTKFGKIDEDFSGGGSSWQADGQRFINNRMTGPLSPLHLKASKPASWENQTTRHSTAHELQHAVDDIEGRPYGVPGTGYHPEYKNSIGEVRARNTQRRADMTDEQLRASPPWTTEDVPYWSQILRPRPLLGATGAGYAASQALAPGEAEAAGFRRPKMPWDRALAGKPTDARMTPNQLLYDRPHGERATRILRKKDARIKAGQRAFGDMNETTRKAFNEMGKFDVPSTLDELDNRADRFAPLSHESLLDLERVGPVQESGALMREGRDWNAIGDRLTQPDFNVPRSRYNALPLALGAGAGLGAAATSGDAEARPLPKMYALSKTSAVANRTIPRTGRPANKLQALTQSDVDKMDPRVALGLLAGAGGAAGAGAAVLDVPGHIEQSLKETAWSEDAETRTRQLYDLLGEAYNPSLYKRQAVPQRGAGLKAPPRTVGGLLSDLLMGRPDPNSIGERTVAPALEQTGEKIGNSTIPGMRYLADAARRDPELAPGYGAALLAPKVGGAAMQAVADVVHDPVAGLAYADGPLAFLGTGVGVVRDLWRERPGRGQQELAWMRLQQMLDPKKRAPAR